MNDSKYTEGLLFATEERGGQENGKEAAPRTHLTKDGKPDRRCKPAIREPRPQLTMQQMRTQLSNTQEIITTKGIRYTKLRLTAHMIIGTRETSGKEFTINLNDLYKAYQNCLRFTSPEVKKYIFMGHSPAVAILRRLQKGALEA